MFARFLLFTHLLVATATAVVSPGLLSSDFSILIHNDLQGNSFYDFCVRITMTDNSLSENSSPWVGSGVLLLDTMPLHRAMQSCQKIGESLWSIETGFSEIQHNLNYLAYEGQKKKNQRYWIASIHGKPSTIDARGRVKEASPDDEFPVLCTQTAPYSTADSQDTDRKWQVTVYSNNDYITG